MSSEAIMLIAKGCEYYEEVKNLIARCPAANIKVFDLTSEINGSPVVIVNDGDIDIHRAPLLIIRNNEDDVCGPDNLPLLFFEGVLYCIEQVENEKTVWSTDYGDSITIDFPPCEAVITRPNHIFELRRRGKIMARMVVKFERPGRPGPFIVLKDSTARNNTLSSMPSAAKQKREELKRNKILKPDQTGKLLVFQKDYPFSSPSAASYIITASSTDGWKEFKLPDGRNLEEFKNQLDTNKETE